MRDYEYIALGLYMSHLNKHGKSHSRTSVLSGIMFGDISPIPKRFVDEGKVIAKEEDHQRATKKEEKEEENVVPIGGGIFTF